MQPRLRRSPGYTLTGSSPVQSILYVLLKWNVLAWTAESPVVMYLQNPAGRGSIDFHIVLDLICRLLRKPFNRTNHALHIRQTGNVSIAGASGNLRGDLSPYILDDNIDGGRFAIEEAGCGC